MVTNDNGRMTKAQKEEYRAARRANWAKALDGANVPFTRHNDDFHWVVEATLGRTYDSWPTTGRWRLRGHRLHGMGVNSLIRDVRREV